MFTHSLFPHPNTRYRTPASDFFSAEREERYEKKREALDAGSPSNDAVMIMTGVEVGRRDAYESRVSRVALKPTLKFS